MIDSLVQQAMAIDNADKAKLIEPLKEALLTPSQKQIERNWALESQRRYDEYKAGRVTTMEYPQIKKSRN